MTDNGLYNNITKRQRKNEIRYYFIFCRYSWYNIIHDRTHRVKTRVKNIKISLYTSHKCIVDNNNNL